MGSIRSAPPSIRDSVARRSLGSPTELLTWVRGSLDQLRRDAEKMMDGEWKPGGYAQRDPLEGASIIREK